jgi:hypothetical protein
MASPMRPVTRLSFVLSILIAPMVSLGCGGDSVTVDTKAGERRRQKMEDLKNKAKLTRKSAREKAP